MLHTFFDKYEDNTVQLDLMDFSFKIKDGLASAVVSLHRFFFFCFLCVCVVLIYDNKYLMMQVLLLLICSDFVSNMYLDKCLLSVQDVSQNETSQFALITVVLNFNYIASADEVLLRFTYGSLGA